MKVVRASLALLLVVAGLTACQVPLTPSGTPPPPTFTPTVDATGATDVSAPMAAFLSRVPNGSTINLKPGGRYRMEQPFTIANRRHLTINGNGATFFATTPGTDPNPTKLRTRANVTIINSAGIIISRLNVIGANPYAGTQDKAYQPKYEAQHGFNIISSAYVALYGCSASDTYGDFVYMGGVPGVSFVLVRDFKGVRSGRQGIAITAADTVVVERSSLREVRRSSIDFEPQGATPKVINVKIRDNTFYGGRLNFVSAHGNNPVDRITIQGNTLTRMVLGISVKDRGGAIRRDWKVLNNRGDVDPLDLNGAGNPGLSAMDFTRVDGLVVQGNYQRMRLGEVPGGLAPFMYGVKAIESSNVVVSGNTFPQSVGQLLSIKPR